jgi:lysine 2,3-aminomutase
MNEPLITAVGELPPPLAASVSPEEKTYIEAMRNRGLLPFGVTPRFASLARPDRDDPIRRQFFPDPREALPDPFALDDPLGAARYQAVPRLVHQYRDRVLLLAGGACAGYCRHCFRRVWLSSAPAFIGDAELGPVFQYLKAHPEIKEALVSGGDPLMAHNDRLEALFRGLREARPGILLRLCTRAPITSPSRLDDGTIALLRRFRPLRLSVHINHPRELLPPSEKNAAKKLHTKCVADQKPHGVVPLKATGYEPSAAALAAVADVEERLAACVNAGIPVHVQTVLLKGINDDPAVLAELFRNCLDWGLSPYYLFQLDLAPGTAHFRVPLRRGLALYRELGTLVYGLALPAYALDLPGGGGKIRLHDGVIAGEKITAAGPVYLLRDGTGKTWEYPADDPV